MLISVSLIICSEASQTVFTLLVPKLSSEMLQLAELSSPLDVANKKRAEPAALCPQLKPLPKGHPKPSNFPIFATVMLHTDTALKSLPPRLTITKRSFLTSHVWISPVQPTYRLIFLPTLFGLHLHETSFPPWEKSQKADFGGSPQKSWEGSTAWEAVLSPAFRALLPTWQPWPQLQLSPLLHQSKTQRGEGVGKVSCSHTKRQYTSDPHRLLALKQAQS